jgi:hypothetical protein
MKGHNVVMFGYASMLVGIIARPSPRLVVEGAVL